MFYTLRSQDINQPIIILTNRDDEERAIHLVRNGAQDYLLKGEISGSLLLRSIYYAIERERMKSSLRETIKKIDTLHGLLPICSSCKQVKDDQGYWHQIEKYISDHSDAIFSHGYCPQCYDQQLIEIEKYNRIPTEEHAQVPPGYRPNS